VSREGREGRAHGVLRCQRIKSKAHPSPSPLSLLQNKRRTGKWEAHVWHSKKQVYLGGFDWEEHAAKAHDIMTLKVRGPAAEVRMRREHLRF
jgi:hypothetical protein